MISVSILAFSSLLALAQNPEPHTQKFIVKNGEVITELGSESKTDTSKEISITIHASGDHDILSGLDDRNDAKVMSRVKVITIDENGNKKVLEFDLDDNSLPELGGDSFDGLPKIIEMLEGQLGNFDIEIDSLHRYSEHGEHDERDQHGEHEGVFMFDRSDMGNNMPHMMDMGDMRHNMPHMMDMGDMRHNMPRIMDMGDMGRIMIMTQPMMMGQNRYQWSDNDHGGNDIADEMHHRIDNLEDMVDEMHHRIDNLEGSLENIESMLHELLERR